MGKKGQALEAKRLNAFAMDPDDLTIVGLDTKDGEEHPLYDERIKLPVEEKLVLNIRVYGVLEPVLVRKNGDVVEVVDGRQRVRAARQANEELRKAGEELVQVPVMLKRGEDPTMIGVMISTNEHRREDELPVKIRKLERFMARGKTEDEAAVAFGVTKVTIKTWLRLLEAGPEINKALREGAINPSSAAKLAKLPREEQGAALREVLETAQGGKVTTAQAERASRNKRLEKESGERQETIVPPGKRLLKKVASAPDLSEDFKTALRWVLGEIPASAVVGLENICEALSAGEAKATQTQEAAQ